MRGAVPLVVLALAGVARADAPADPVVEGAALATQGRFKDAIAKFKIAHAADPNRAEPLCMIALAYRRLERWGQAKLYLTRCLTFDAKPDWADAATADIDAGITHGGLAPVSFVIEPKAAVEISVASFAGDETFAPQTIYLEPGKQLLSIAAKGFKTQQLAIEVPSNQPYEVKIVLEADGTKPLVPAVVRPAPSVLHDRSHLAKPVLIGSAAVLGLAIVVHLVAFSSRSHLVDDASNPQNDADYQANIGTFKTERAIALTGYGLAAIGGAIGVWLWHSESNSMQSAFVPQLARGNLGLAWSHGW